VDTNLEGSSEDAKLDKRHDCLGMYNSTLLSTGRYETFPCSIAARMMWSGEKVVSGVVPHNRPKICRVVRDRYASMRGY
jgi:hypothetical protein